MGINIRHTKIPSDYTRSFKFDGNGNSDTGSLNATVTNGTYTNTTIGYQRQCLVWGATTTCTYTSVTYTNSYIWIYASGVWTFTKNSGKVSAIALTGTNGERYAMLRFYNKTLTESEEQALELEGKKLLGPSNLASYPKLLEGIVYYADFRGTPHNLVNGVTGTVTGATLTTDRFGNSNSAYSFTGTNNISNAYNSSINVIPISISIYCKLNTSTQSVDKRIFDNWDETTGSGNYAGLMISHHTNGTGMFTTRVVISNGSVGNYTENIQTYGVADTNYHLITVTITGTTSNIYMDGVFIGNKTNHSSLLYRNLTWYIGAIHSEYNGVNTAFEGGIDFCMIHNKLLSADEVKLLYNLTSKDYIYPNKNYDLPSLREGLVLDLNEQGKDLSGLGNHGTLVGSPTVIRQGKANGLSYNGTTQYVSLPALGITSNVTLSCWVNSSQLVDVTKSGTPIGNLDQAVGTGSPCLQYSAGVLYLGKSYIANILSINITTLTSNNKWTHLIGTYNGTTAKLYLNGKLITSGAYSITFTGTCPMAIGRQGTGYYITGSSMYNKIRNRVLSDKEIQALYYSTAGNFNY